MDRFEFGGRDSVMLLQFRRGKKVLRRVAGCGEVNKAVVASGMHNYASLPLPFPLSLVRYLVNRDRERMEGKSADVP